MRKKPTPAFARVIIQASENANVTWIGTAIRISQKVLVTAGQICLSVLNR